MRLVDALQRPAGHPLLAQLALVDLLNDALIIDQHRHGQLLHSVTGLDRCIGFDNGIRDPQFIPRCGQSLEAPGIDSDTEHFVVVFDAPGKTFRDDLYPEYKANRDADLPPPTIYKGKEYPVYNNTGRGYPDVAALGGTQNPYCITAGGNVVGVAGTSAASPVTAAVFALLNGIRLGAGKPALGWLNPFIYQNAAAFHDVTHGMNNASNKYGFTAIKGWDPASGVGTPNLAALKTAVDALP